MIKYMLTLFFACSVSCKTIPLPPDPIPVDKCPIADKIGDILMNPIKDAFKCSNPGAIKADVIKKVYEVGLCKDYEQGKIGDYLCQLLTDKIRDMLTTKAFPERWRCEGGVPVDTLINFLYSKCTGKGESR